MMATNDAIKGSKIILQKKRLRKVRDMRLLNLRLYRAYRAKFVKRSSSSEVRQAFLYAPTEYQNNLWPII